MAVRQRKNSRDKKASEKSVNNAYITLNVNVRQKNAGRIPTLVTYRLYRQAEYNIFTSEEEKDRDREIAQKTELFDFLKNSSLFDNSTVRTLYALCFALTNGDDNKDLLTFSEKSTTTHGELGVSEYVCRTLLIKDFTKFIFGCHCLHDRAITVIKDIIKLSTFSCVWNYDITTPSGETEKWRKIGTLIHYEVDIPDAAGRTKEDLLEDIYNRGKMTIIIGRALLHNIEKRFAYIPKALITEWGKNKTQNDLFPLILSETLSLQGNYRDAAYKRRKKVVEENKKYNRTKEEGDRILEEETRKMLTCRIMFKTIAENSAYDYVTKGRWVKMEKQIEANMDFLKNKIYLIEDYKIGGTKGSQKYVEFIYNLDYPQPKKKALKQ